jgi:osmotically-inducible protein OsmY
VNRLSKKLSAVMLATALLMTTGACAGHRTAGETISDASMTASVKTRLLADQRTDGLKIDVDTQSGVVYLSGEVDSSEEVKLAESIAKRVDGVASVENNLRVKHN